MVLRVEQSSQEKRKWIYFFLIGEKNNVI